MSVWGVGYVVEWFGGERGSVATLVMFVVLLNFSEVGDRVMMNFRNFGTLSAHIPNIKYRN